MKKSKTGIIIAAALVFVLIWAGVIGFAVFRFVAKTTGAYTEALNRKWSSYSAEADGELFTALNDMTEAKVKSVSKTNGETSLTVEVNTKDFGSEARKYREKNEKFLPAGELVKKQLELLNGAKSVSMTYRLSCKGEKENPDIELSGEFINAMLGFVYTDEEVKAEGFSASAVSGFNKAADINSAVEIDYEKLETILRNATSLHRYENKIYYATYKTTGSYETSEYYTRKLKCYDMETGQDNTLYSFDCYWDEYGSSASLIQCLTDGVLVANQIYYYESESNNSYEAFVFDYKEEKSKKIKLDTIPVFEAAVIADYKDGVIYYTAGQDGFGDIKKFAVDDDVESIAVDYENSYVYMNDVYVDGSDNIYFDMMDMEAYEASGYEIMNYSIYRNNGTSIGEALVSDYDGGFSLCDNGDILFFRNTKLMKYSASEKKESEVCDTQLKRHRLSVRFITDEYAYIVGYRDEKDDEGYYTQKGYMYKLNLKTGDKELIKGVPERVLFEY